ncbi:MAG: hypothetical protein GEU80_09350 [Dehalococcoidia bacterium]|nr:hypothetical protein [Dehalococcoidia bacterium]
MKINKTGWTITGVTAAAVTVGLAGNALASGGGGEEDLPGAITLQDRVPVEAQEFTPEEPGYEVVPRPVFQADSHGNFDSLTASLASPDGTVTDAPATSGTAGVDDTLDSPDNSFNDADDSPASGAIDAGPMTGQADASYDSPVSVDSPDQSVDSVDSVDSPDNSN